MSNTFIPLVEVTSDLYIANNEASRIARPHQGENKQPLFWISYENGFYGATRNLNLSGARQEEAFAELSKLAI